MNQIFVFGSNLAGKHFGGSAAHAVKEHGSIIGQGVGLQGSSYAIPTLDENFQKLTLEQIAEHVEQFKWYAAINPETEFHVVAIGCGIAGFTPDQIAPMFWGSTDNVVLPREFFKCS